MVEERRPPAWFVDLSLVVWLDTFSIEKRQWRIYLYYGTTEPFVSFSSPPLLVPKSLSTILTITLVRVPPPCCRDSEGLQAPVMAQDPGRLQGRESGQSFTCPVCDMPSGSHEWIVTSVIAQMPWGPVEVHV
jgi:hypothetical protein